MRFCYEVLRKPSNFVRISKIYSAHQWSDFYAIRTSVMKELKNQKQLMSSRYVAAYKMESFTTIVKGF